MASFKLAAIVKRLPKTRSGKILRATMRKMANGEEVEVPATIDDPAICRRLKRRWRGWGIRRGRRNEGGKRLKSSLKKAL